jgi:hypothetical protein
MRTVAAGSEWRAVISEVKSRFGIGKIVNVKSVCVQTRRQIIGRDEIYNGRETRFGTNFQQALYDFDWSKASHRVSVCCHLFPAPLFRQVSGGPTLTCAERPSGLALFGCTPFMSQLFALKIYF